MNQLQIIDMIQVNRHYVISFTSRKTDFVIFLNIFALGNNSQ